MPPFHPNLHRYASYLFEFGRRTKKVTGTPVISARYGSSVIQSELKMDKDRIEGSASQAKGAVKQGVGKITGDAKLQAEGAADKAKGKAQNAVGGVKDALRDANKH
jgi:uncharacterized protein YjbJ (UPF0337 family)